MAAPTSRKHVIGWLAALLLAGGAAHATRSDRRASLAPVKNAAGMTAMYYGGPVTANAKVYVLWWGDPSMINPAITAAKGGIVDFFTGVTNSSYMDMLNQYNTTVNANAGSHSGMAGTGQRIGRGNYAGTFTLSNIPSGDVTDAQIQTAISQAVTAGTLPPPDDNALYAVFFPASITITLDGDKSCQTYGAYHDAIMPTSGHAIYYLVMPDCGGSFASMTSTTSHELIEAITDNLPTAGSMPDYPQAWNDTMGDEMADLCEGGNSGATVMTPVGSFTVQTIWDERSQSCKAFSSDANDFNVALSPNVATVDLNVPTTYMVQTATSAGTAQMLTLTATAPTGVTATVSPTSVMAGGTATLTVTATNPPMQTGNQVVVRADATSGSTVQTHTASLLLSTTSAPPGGDLGASPADMATAASDMAMAGDDAGMSGGGGGSGTGGNGDQPGMPKGCGCVIGAASGSALDGTWVELLLVAFAIVALRRRRAE